jgi:hypothetical protein
VQILRDRGKLGRWRQIETVLHCSKYGVPFAKSNGETKAPRG